MTYNTLNPVPSTDPRDLDDNAQAFDRFLQSIAASEPDRLGVQRKTWSQMERDASALVSPNVAALSGLTGAADRLPYFTDSGAMSLAVLTTVARTLLAAATQAAQRTALGLGSAALLPAGTANGAATLDANGLLPVSQLPPLAINATFTVANQAAMLALTAERGDVAIRTDLNGAAYLLTADVPATLANWVPIQQNLGVALTALSALTPATDMLPYFSGTAVAALTAFTAQARTLLAAATQAAQRTALGVAYSAWVNLTLANSWTLISGRRAAFRTFLDIVTLEVQIAGGTDTDGTVLFTLPAGSRPLSPLAVPVAGAPKVALSTTVAVPRVVVNIDGTVTCQNTAAAAGICFSIQFATV